MKVIDLLLENPQSSRFVIDLARQVVSQIERLLPTPTDYLEIDLGNYAQGIKYLSDVAVGVNRGTGSIGGVYDHPNKLILIENGFDDNRVHHMLEQVIVHELSHVLDGTMSNMRVFKPNKIAYPHKPTEVNSRFNELIYLLDNKFRGKRVTFETYAKTAMSMLKQVELNPTSFENIELYAPKHLRHLPVGDTINHLRPMLGIQHKTYKRILKRLYVNWKFQYDN